MKRNMRSGWWKVLSGAVVVFGVLAFIAGSGFAEYIEEEQLVRTEPVNPPEIRVDVELTASPTEGPAPLSVSFTCTAEAVIHELDEIWAQPPQGSVEDIRPVYKTEPAEIISQPSDTVLKKPGAYPFTATAEYKGVTGQDTVTVIIKKPSCADLFAKKAELEKELAELNKQLSKLEAEKEKLEAERDKQLDKLDEELAKEIFEIDKKIEKLESRKLELLLKSLQISILIKDLISRQMEIEALLEELRADKQLGELTVALIESVVAYFSGGATFSYIDITVIDKVIKHLEQSIKWYEKQINSLEDKIADYKNAMIQIEHKIELYGAREEGVINWHKTEVKQLQVQFENKIQARQKAINDFLSKITVIEKEIKAIEQQLKDRGCVK